ncbi:MAG: TonB-dependent receptor plug domain-containing protein [Alistipes senegalensis]
MPEFYIRRQNSITTELNTSADISRQNLTNNSNLPDSILDGFEVDVEKIYDMDPMRVHSITLLKDAAATVLYGSRAANGVVVIELARPGGRQTARLLQPDRKRRDARPRPTT